MRKSYFIQTTIEIKADDDRGAMEHLRFMLMYGDRSIDHRHGEFVRVTSMCNAFGERHTVECNNSYRESSGERKCICPRKG